MATNAEQTRKSKVSFWIRRGLEKHGLAQAELARLVGVTADTVSSWVTGKQIPHRSNLRAVRDVFAELSEIESANKVLVHSPLRLTDCAECPHREECALRTKYGYFLMCESLSEKNLRWAQARGVLQQVIWWEEIDPSSTLEELVEALEITWSDITKH